MFYGDHDISFMFSGVQGVFGHQIWPLQQNDVIMSECIFKNLREGLYVDKTIYNKIIIHHVMN